MAVAKADQKRRGSHSRWHAGSRNERAGINRGPQPREAPLVEQRRKARVIPGECGSLFTGGDSVVKLVSLEAPPRLLSEAARGHNHSHEALGEPLDAQSRETLPTLAASAVH